MWTGRQAAQSLHRASSYDVTYRYRKQLQPTNLDDTGFDVEGAVEGSLILVDYKWKMPRFDLVSIDASGNVRRVKGLAHQWRPSIPRSPEGQLDIALIEQTWENDTPCKNHQHCCACHPDERY